MRPMLPDRLDSLTRWPARELGASTVRLSVPTTMSGGAIHENWSLDAAVADGPNSGPISRVLRTDAPSCVSASHSPPEEFALLLGAFLSGALLPDPLVSLRDNRRG